MLMGLVRNSAKTSFIIPIYVIFIKTSLVFAKNHYDPVTNSLKPIQLRLVLQSVYHL